MRRIVTGLVLGGLLFSPVWALAFDFKPAGLTPVSFWYFLETAKEEIVLFFTFSPVQKIEKLIQFSSEKMSEINKTLASHPDKAKVSLRRAQSLLARVKKIAPTAKKDRFFQLRRKQWQEILAQELVFLTEHKNDLSVGEVIKVVKEVKQTLR